MFSPAKPQVIGDYRLTKDVELRYTAQGKAVAKLSLAGNRSYKSGEKDGKAIFTETAVFINASAWGKRAETYSQYLKKGDLVSLSADVAFRTWRKEGDQYDTVLFEPVIQSLIFRSHPKDAAAAAAVEAAGAGSEEDVPGEQV